MGRCKFKDSWLDDVRFRSWLASVANPEEARCILCKTTIKLGTMGIKAVVSHMQCQKHKTFARSHFAVLHLCPGATAADSGARSVLVALLLALT